MRWAIAWCVNPSARSCFRAMSPCWRLTSAHAPAAICCVVCTVIAGERAQRIEIRPPWDDLDMATTTAEVLVNFVGGGWREAGGEETIETRNPATGELLGHVPLSQREDVDAAVTAAREAQREWGTTSPVVRARHLFALREVLDAHREELARLVTTDMGKTNSDALAEVGRGI